MSIPRMRTVPEAFRELKKADPDTAYTLRALRADVNNGKIPFVQVGNGGTKRLINLDQLFAMLGAPSCLPGQNDGETGKIRPVR